MAAKRNNIDANCNKVFNAKCNNFSMYNVITFLAHNVIMQNVSIREVKSKNAHGMCIQAGYWCEWTGATERAFITEKYHILGGGAGLLCFGKQGPGPRVASC